MTGLCIAHTWSGQAIPREEQVRVVFEPRGPNLSIGVDAPFHGDAPPPAPPGHFGSLWEFEVVEVFIVGRVDPGGDTHYVEIELGPLGHHLILEFRGVRKRVETHSPVSYCVNAVGCRWQGEVLLARRLIPPPPHRLNLFAIHGAGTDRRHLAWIPVSGSAPDFHQPMRFPAFVLP